MTFTKKDLKVISDLIDEKLDPINGRLDEADKRLDEIDKRLDLVGKSLVMIEIKQDQAAKKLNNQQINMEFAEEISRIIYHLNTKMETVIEVLKVCELMSQ